MRGVGTAVDNLQFFSRRIGAWDRMRLSYFEARAISKAREGVELWRGDKLHEDEVVCNIVHYLIEAGEQSDRVVPYCVAALTVEMRARLRVYIKELEDGGFRDWFSVWSLSEGRLEWLRPRCRIICEEIELFLEEIERRPDLLEEAASHEFDFYWIMLRELQASGYGDCKAIGCSGTSLPAEIYCARHLYEHVKGKSPPED